MKKYLKKIILRKDLYSKNYGQSTNEILAYNTEEKLQIDRYGAITDILTNKYIETQHI